VQDLASRGYVVVTIDATYEASEVEFPGGRIVTSVLSAELARAQKNHTIGALLRKVLTVRVADTRFVAGHVAALAAGHDPGAGRPPPGLAAAIDPHRIGMFGVSAGGFTAAQAMAEDPRIKAGIDLGGATDTPLVKGSQHLAPVFDHGLRQPFLLTGDPATTHHTVASWRSFWNRTGSCAARPARCWTARHRVIPRSSSSANHVLTGRAEREDAHSALSS
jgi:hypothetical protein